MTPHRVAEFSDFFLLYRRERPSAQSRQVLIQLVSIARAHQAGIDVGIAEHELITADGGGHFLPFGPAGRGFEQAPPVRSVECDDFRLGILKLGKDLDDYKSQNSSSVQVALQQRENGRHLKSGDFVEYITTEGRGAQYKRAVEANAPGIIPDYVLYANKLISVVKQILPNEDWVKNFGKKRKHL